MYGQCPQGYSVKVTKHGTSDGYDGIIWHLRDGKRYLKVEPAWCFRSIEEAEAEAFRGKYRFRRPYYS